jgi:hypothetical protein
MGHHTVHTHLKTLKPVLVVRAARHSGAADGGGATTAAAASSAPGQ